MCAALKGEGYNPRAEFFIALARFNQYVADGDFKSVQKKFSKIALQTASRFVMTMVLIMALLNFGLCMQA